MSIIALRRSDFVLPYRRGGHVSIRSHFLYALSIILAGCVDVSDDGMKAVSVPAGEALEQETFSKATPIRQFDRLSDLIESAIATHPSIVEAAASVREAQADAKSVGLRRLPRLSIESRLIDSAGGSTQFVGVLEQPIWTGGQITAAIDQARSRLRAAIEAYDDATIELALAVCQSYFEAARWSERATILEQSVTQHNELVAMIERRYQKSAALLSDVELARARALQINLQLDQERAQEVAAVASLRQLTDALLPTSIEPYSVPGSWPNFEQELVVPQILVLSPRLERLRHEIQSLSAEAEAAKASRFPQVSAQYTVDGSSSGKAEVLLKFQTGGAFSHRAAVEAAVARLEAGVARRASAEQQLREQAIILLSQYDSAVSQATGRQSSAGLAQRVMDAYTRQFDSGRKSWLDVMNAMREASTAETDAVDARILALSSLAKILILSGQWTVLSPSEGK